MTFVYLALASILLAFGPQVVLSFNSITFSAVQQCGNFSVHFTGGKLPASLPLTLTVVPFNLTPISIEISSSDWNNVTLTGAAVTFLPFPTGTQFVASLDDANGASTGPVSDIIPIDSSDDTSCLSSSSTTPQRFTVATPLSQCEDFQVTYDTSLVDAPPTVRAFVPNGQSVFLNEDILASSSGRTAYSMAAAHGEQVVLAFSDDTGFRQATELLVVGGNSSSPTACLPSSQTATASSGTATATGSSSSSSSGLSQGSIIGIGVACGVAVGGIALGMVFWFRRERNRARRQTFRSNSDPRAAGGNNASNHQTKMSMFLDSPGFSPGLASEAEKPLPKPPSVATGESQFISMRNPPYTKAVLDLATPLSISPSPMYPPSNPTSSSGRRPPSIPIPMYTPKSSFSGLDGGPIPENAPVATWNSERGRTPSLSSDDIENILDMATMYSTPGPSGGRQSSILQGLSPGPLPSWTLSRDPNSARNSPVTPDSTQPLNLAPPRSRSPSSGLLTPLTASTTREPPHAQLPSSPGASPMTPGFSRPSIDDVLSTSSSGIGNWEFVTPRS